jgi:hypothetical protein
MSTTKTYSDDIELLPFDELVKLNSEGKLGEYAEQVTQEFLEKHSGFSQKRAARLNSLALKLSAIRARHPKGLKAFLEINTLMQTSHAEFLDRIETIIKGTPESSTCTNETSTRVIPFPLRPPG